MANRKTAKKRKNAENNKFKEMLNEKRFNKK